MLVRHLASKEKKSKKIKKKKHSNARRLASKNKRYEQSRFQFIIKFKIILTEIGTFFFSFFPHKWDLYWYAKRTIEVFKLTRRKKMDFSILCCCFF